MSAWVRVDRFRGVPSVVLSSERLEATFLPSLGMLGASLTLDGEEYLSLHGGPRAFSAGHTTGLALLHPWANRLGANQYRAAGRDVPLEGSSAVRRDANGLPIHGTMVGAREWHIVELRAGARRANLVAAYEYGADQDELAAFPFPHVIEVQASVRDQTLRVRTSVRPTTKVKVPVSFGWHPYFRIPGVRRSEWSLKLPKRKHLVLDDRGLPTGEVLAEKAENESISHRAFDDAYQLGGKGPWALGLTGGAKSVSITLDEGYPFAQVYIPPRKLFAAIEPMTAPVNALVTGDAPKVRFGMEFYSGFTIELSADEAVSG